MSDKIDSSIVCAYLYIISQYGYPPPAKNTFQYLGQMKALGFESVELEGIRRDHLLEMYRQRHEIAAHVEALELNVPYFCVVLPGLASADRNEREENLQLFRKGCETAELLNAKGVLDNAPLPPYVFPESIPIVRHYDDNVLQAAHFPTNLSWDAYWRDLTNTYRMACNIATEFGLTYQMHSCLGVLAATTDAFLNFYDAVGCDNLRFNLDTANQFVLKDNLALSLRRLAAHIDYIHLSDNRGVEVEHLVPGQGQINWPVFFETLDRIGFDGLIGLDIGGDESEVGNIDRAYLQSADWLTAHWSKTRSAVDNNQKIG
jgi:sugar phosphate isomerase/epimerase